MEKQTFNVTGMTCAACQAAVDRAVRKLDGVESADVSLLSESMNVEYDPKKVTAEQIEEAVKSAGYGATPQQTEESGKTESAAQIWEQRSERIRAESEQKKKKLIISLILLCVLLCFSMLPMLGVFTFLMDMEWMMVDGVIQLLLSTIILFVQRDFFTHGFKTLFHGSPNMDTLVAVGSSVSFAYGFYGLLLMAYGYGTMDHALIHSGMNALYFESASMIVTLVSLGKYLEARSKSKTGDAIAKLVSLAPKTAMVVRNGEFVEIPAEDVRIGDKIRIVPGASIPVDGVLVEGNGTLDQSAITGESMPVDKVKGDQIMSASTNLNGSFVMEATRVGSDTTLAQIITLVDEAGNSKAPIARLADRVSGIFVPTVLTISALTFVGWLIAGQSIGFALNCAISVLVISCPCALGLATPLAIMVATGKAAQYGILVKSASALETLAKVNTVVLDKTGTITKGQPAVVSVALFNRTLSESDFLKVAAAAESGSEHPLAKAVLARAKDDHLVLPEAKDFQAFGGKGMRAVVNGITVLAGNQTFMNEQHIALPAQADEAAAKIADQGGTPLYFAFDGILTGIIGAADEVRASSRDAISLLRKDGIEVIMLTGDNARTAKAIASKLDVSDVISDVLPADKESVIRKLQEQGKITAMVGDGINDAPALTRADVGFAIKSGTDIAIDSADIVLMKNSLLDVVTAIELSRSTIKNIKENLFWAFFYNLLGIPVAMGLFYPFNGWLLNPMIGAAAMSFSSVTVCLNALRLRFFKPARAVLEDEKESETGSSSPAAPAVYYDLEEQPAAIIPAAAAEEPAKPASSAHPDTTGLTGTKLSLKMAGSPTRKSAAAPATQTEKADQPAALQTTFFLVDGMSCAHCSGRVTKALEAVEGVTGVKVSHEEGTAWITADRKIDDDVLAHAVTEAGYEVRSDEPSMCANLAAFDPKNQSAVDDALNRIHQLDLDLSWISCFPDEKMLCIHGDPLPEEQNILGLFEADQAASKDGKGGESMILKIDGMSCKHCQARVEKALSEVPGVDSVTVSLENGTAEVKGADLNPSALAKAVTAAGYSVSAID